MIYTPSTLAKLFPQGVKYHWKSPYTYDNLEWNDESVAKPTEAEIAAVNDEAIRDQEFKTLRRQRNQLLTETDYLGLPDLGGFSAEMTAYRQALRDLPANTTDPANPAWPTKPGGES